MDYSYAEYLETVLLAQLDEPSWRLGQAAFNVLVRHHPDLAKRVRGTHRDPFHTDDIQVLCNFLTWVRYNW